MDTGQERVICSDKTVQLREYFVPHVPMNTRIHPVSILLIRENSLDKKFKDQLSKILRGIGHSFAKWLQHFIYIPRIFEPGKHF